MVWESPIRAYYGHCPLSGLRKVCQLHFILSYPLRGILFLFLTVLLSGKRIHWFKQTQLIICNIVLQLVPYVFFYSLLIFPYCIHIVLSAYGYDPDTLLPLWFRFLSAHTVFSVFFQCLFLFGYISPFFCISVQIPHDTCNSTLNVLNYLYRLFSWRYLLCFLLLGWQTLTLL